MAETDEKKRPVIYCVEGHWGDDPYKEPSVEPILQMLQRRDLWPYVRRNAARVDELFYWMSNEWDSCAYGSILYFATHGAEGEIWLGRDEHPSASAQIEKPAAEINCSRCLVHFSGCSTLACNEARVRSFMERSGAVAVSGYRTAVGWTGSWRPAALLELMLFSVIAEKIDLTHKTSRRKLPS